MSSRNCTVASRLPFPASDSAVCPSAQSADVLHGQSIQALQPLVEYRGFFLSRVYYRGFRKARPQEMPPQGLKHYSSAEPYRRAFLSRPLASRSFTRSRWPASAARCNAVDPPNNASHSKMRATQIRHDGHANWLDNYRVLSRFHLSQK